MYAYLLDRRRHSHIQRDVHVVDAVLHSAFRWSNTATCVHSHNQLRLFNHNTVDIVDLYKRLYREHEKLEGVWSHRTLISPGERECANQANWTYLLIVFLLRVTP